MSREFNGASGLITTGLTTHATDRSYSVWAYIVSSGEGTKGRIFDKSTGGVLMDQLQIEGDDTPDTILYLRSFSGADGVFKFSIPALTTWHHFGVTFNAVAGSHAIMYLNGASQTLTTDEVGVGTVDTNASPYIIGNRSDDLRTWDGRIAEFAVWDTILTSDEMLALAGGAAANLIQPGSLVSYLPLLGAVAPEPDLKLTTAATVTGSPGAAHPPVFTAPRIALFRQTKDGDYAKVAGVSERLTDHPVAAVRLAAQRRG
jgi:hypothetical protein